MQMSALSGRKSQVASYVPMNLSKKASFSASFGSEKWPPFPWLKSHGPIEALEQEPAKSTPDPEFPWLKSHGPIEASNTNRIEKRHLGFPWLKSHGPIEALRRSSFVWVRPHFHG